MLSHKNIFTLQNISKFSRISYLRTPFEDDLATSHRRKEDVLQSFEITRRPLLSLAVIAVSLPSR